MVFDAFIYIEIEHLSYSTTIVSVPTKLVSVRFLIFFFIFLSFYILKHDFKNFKLTQSNHPRLSTGSYLMIFWYNVQNVQSVYYTTTITQIVLVSWHFRNIENIKCIVINIWCVLQTLRKIRNDITFQY